MICKDSAPQNPDEMILQCANKECNKWMHVKCIAEEAVREAGKCRDLQRISIFNSYTADDAADEQKATKKRKLDNIKIGPRSLAQAKAQKGSFTAEIFIKGLPDGEESTPAERTEIIVTDGEGEKHAQSVGCLFCGTEIE